MNGKSEKLPEDRLFDALFGANRETTAQGEPIDKLEETYLDKWDALCNIETPEAFKESLYNHLNVLADTKECEQLLKDIIARAQKAEVVSGRLDISISTVSGEIAKLVCLAPSLKESDISAYPYSDILALYGGLSFPGVGQDAFKAKFGISAPVFLNGPNLSTMFDPETPEEEALLIAIDTHQDWFVASRDKMIVDNKPLVSLLSHGSAQEQIISDSYSVGGHYLRLIALTILGDDDLRANELSHYI